MEMTVGGEGAAEGAAKEAVLGVAEQVEEGLEVVALAASMMAMMETIMVAEVGEEAVVAMITAGTALRPVRISNNSRAMRNIRW